MADDALSAAELEALLTARSAAPIAGLPQIKSPRPGEWGAQREARRVTGSRPSLCEKLRMAAVAICDACAARFAEELSAMLRRDARVKLVAANLVTAREFAARLCDPTCCSAVSAAPLVEAWIVEIPPAILFPAIDGMLGGGRKPAAIAARPLTDIELRLAGRVVNLFVRALRSAWRGAVELDLSVRDVAGRPPASAMPPERDAVLWVRYEIELCGVRGPLNLAIPAASLQAVAEQLTGPRTTSSAEGEAEEAGRADEGNVELVARLASARIEPEELRKLAVGDVITTGQKADAPIVVFEDGSARFQARIGAAGGHKAVEIVEPVAPESGEP